MPKGPKVEKRPADVIGNAVEVMRIAAGKADRVHVDDGSVVGSHTTSGQIGLAARLAMCVTKTKLAKNEREWLDLPSVGREKIDYPYPRVSRCRFSDSSALAYASWASTLQ
jgi:hypothetical protein